MILVIHKCFVEVKNGLSAFKQEQTWPKNYVPVTMDELMNRFVLNIKRGELLESFNYFKSTLEKDSLRVDSVIDVEDNVKNSISVIKQMLNLPII